MAFRYRKPKICKNKDNKWFVEYYFYNHKTDKFQRFKVYEDINRFEGPERTQYAKDLRDAVQRALELGYNPFDDAEETEERHLKVERVLTVSELLDRFIKEKVETNLSKRTVQHYETFANHLKKWLIATNNQNKEIGFLDDQQIHIHLQYMKNLKDWRGNTYNNHRDEFFIFFNWLNDNDLHDYKLNPKKIPAMKSDTTRNEYYHGELRDKVRAELVKNPVLDRFCRAIYYTCLRPFEELCHIKIEDIDYTNRLIKIKTHIGKTGYRFVPICEEFEDLLKNDLKIQDYEPSFYIFSTDAMPGKYPVSKNYYTTKYKALKDKLNLGLEYTMYSWKHTRVTDLLMNGFSDAEVMDLTGHRETSSYDHYKRNLGQKINSKIKGKTMDF